MRLKIGENDKSKVIKCCEMSEKFSIRHINLLLFMSYIMTISVAFYLITSERQMREIHFNFEKFVEAKLNKCWNALDNEDTHIRDG